MSESRWLNELAFGNRHYILACVAAGSFAALATIGQAALLAAILQAAMVEQQPLAEQSPFLFALVALIVTKAVAQGLQERFALTCSHQVRRVVRLRLNQNWRKNGPVAIGQHPSGDLAREWIDQVEALHGYFARFLPQAILAVVVPLMILIVVFCEDWLAGLILLASGAVTCLAMALTSRFAVRLNLRHIRSMVRLSGQFLDKVRGLTTLQLFGQAERVATVIQHRSDEFRRIRMRIQTVAGLYSTAVELFAALALALIAIYVGFGLAGSIQLGPSSELTLFSGLLLVLLTPAFFQPIRMLSRHYPDWAVARAAAKDILSRLSSLPEIRRNHRSVPAEAKANTVELCGLSYSYGDDSPVISGLTRSIQKGDCIALTGNTGNGKSTLLRLIAGFLQPTTGSVSVFGQPPGAVPFGWLGQRGFLIHGTWADNLRLTSPDASDIAIETALDRVGLGPTIRSLEHGIHHRVTEDGQGLSSGHIRRLNLARIFLADYDLILLDEPTEGLDADSEIYILESLHKLAQAGKTLIVVTHHQALLTLADHVMLICEGQVRDA